VSRRLSPPATAAQRSIPDPRPRSSLQADGYAPGLTGIGRTCPKTAILCGSSDPLGRVVTLRMVPAARPRQRFGCEQRRSRSNPRRGGASRDGRSGPKGRESGECRIKLGGACCSTPRLRSGGQDMRLRAIMAMDRLGMTLRHPEGWFATGQDDRPWLVNAPLVSMISDLPSPGSNGRRQQGRLRSFLVATAPQ
jgi:hypothetical protein